MSVSLGKQRRCAKPGSGQTQRHNQHKNNVRFIFRARTAPQGYPIGSKRSCMRVRGDESHAVDTDGMYRGTDDALRSSPSRSSLVRRRRRTRRVFVCECFCNVETIVVCQDRLGTSSTSLTTCRQPRSARRRTASLRQHQHQLIAKRRFGSVSSPCISLT